ncbi:ROK family protein [Tardiphaga sp. OK245]|uniref:ROK family protein n=1 Tax=Tardiphaga sp. OK245 TaxID=1855306 RepID=UPI0008A73609|nr:ROK family protein [Tardiphaga sp. OK245]SEH40659.1 glucokinase [Tardiphaga sp. OK245]
MLLKPLGKTVHLGIDLGGSAIRAALVHGSVLLPKTFQRTDYKDDAATALNDVIVYYLDLAKRLDLVVEQIDIALAGNIEPTSRVIVSSPTIPSLRGRHLEDLVENFAGLTITAHNDANARTLGEWHVSESPKTDNFVAIFVGSGIGGGAVCGGKLFLGEHGAASEVGHIAVEYEGYPCPCGGRGCVEQYASGTAILRRANDLAGTSDRVSFETALSLLQALRVKDAIAVQTYREAAQWLSMSLASLINLYDPGIVVLGGGVMESTDGFFETVVEGTRGRLMPLAKQGARFTRASLGDTGGVLGAVLMSYT